MPRAHLGLSLALLSLAAGFACAPAARANGMIVTPADGPSATPAPADPSPVTLVRHRVVATFHDRVAKVEVEQAFRSRAQVALEGTYVFPLPDGAAVGGFALTVGGKTLQGEVLDASKARSVYEEIVRRRRDPGLLEYAGRGLYRARVFPIPAGGEVAVHLSYEQVLPEDAGTLEFRYPLASARFGAGVVDDVRVEATIESDVDVKGVYSPSHVVTVKRDGERKAAAVYERKGAVQDRDFLLYVARSPEAVGFATLSHKEAGEDGTFLAVIAPRNDVKLEEVVPRDLVYVLDVSGSMDGAKLAQAKQAIEMGIGLLREQDRFSVISFSTTTNSFRSDLVPATAANRTAAAEWVHGLRALGGTNIGEALARALSIRSERRVPIVVFVTDGLPTVGETDPEAILRSVRGGNASSARVFTFGVGADLDVALLDRVAEATGGARDYVLPGEDLEISTGRFFTKVDRPVLSDVRIDFGPHVTDVYPQRIPDLFVGSQVVVFGRYREAGPRVVTLRGHVGDKEVVREYPCAWKAGPGADFLPRLWAHRKVAYLLDQIRLHGADRELVDDVTRLATRHGFVTPYTAGLVVEDTAGSGLTELGGLPPRASRGGSGQFRGPGSGVPPGLREPSDPTAPLPTVPPPPTTPTTTPDPAGAPMRRSRDLARQKEDGGAGAPDVKTVRTAAGKTFVLSPDGRWLDTAYDGKAATTKVEAFSTAYFALLADHPEAAKLLAVGDRVVFLLGNVAYEIVPAPK